LVKSLYSCPPMLRLPASVACRIPLAHPCPPKLPTALCSLSTARVSCARSCLPLPLCVLTPLAHPFSPGNPATSLTLACVPLCTHYALSHAPSISAGTTPIPSVPPCLHQVCVQRRQHRQEVGHEGGEGLGWRVTGVKGFPLCPQLACSGDVGGRGHTGGVGQGQDEEVGVGKVLRWVWYEKMIGKTQCMCSRIKNDTF